MLADIIEILEDHDLPVEFAELVADGVTGEWTYVHPHTTEKYLTESVVRIAVFLEEVFSAELDDDTTFCRYCGAVITDCACETDYCERCIDDHDGACLLVEGIKPDDFVCPVGRC